MILFEKGIFKNLKKMGPKKKEGKSAAGETVEGEDPTVLCQNYQKYCKWVDNWWYL